MSNIRIIFRDGTVRDFTHQGRAGGSWTKSVKYKDGFVIVEDEWERRTVFPAELIAEVQEEPTRC